MYDEERVYANIETGKIIRFPGVVDHNTRRLSLFKGRMLALTRYAQANKLSVYFLTLTVRDPKTMDELPLKKFLDFLRVRFSRRGLPFKYVWVPEIQQKRFLKTGVLAPHWPIAIACPVGSLPDVKFEEKAAHHYHLVSDGLVVNQADLFKIWGNGQVMCQPSRGPVMKYMAKYMGKTLDDDGLFARRFGSSVFTWWKSAQWAFASIKALYDQNMDILRVWFTHGLFARIAHVKYTDGLDMKYLELESPWRPLVSL
jgi:hypothetical protein